MNIFTEVLVACVILSCVTLGIYMQYKEDNRSEFDSLPVLDYSYSTGVVEAKAFVDDYFTKTYSLCDKEAFTFYLLCLLSRHKLQNYIVCIFTRYTLLLKVIMV